MLGNLFERGHRSVNMTFSFGTYTHQFKRHKFSALPLTSLTRTTGEDCDRKLKKFSGCQFMDHLIFRLLETSVCMYLSVN